MFSAVSEPHVVTCPDVLQLERCSTQTGLLTAKQRA